MKISFSGLTLCCHIYFCALHLFSRVFTDILLLTLSIYCSPRIPQCPPVLGFPLYHFRNSVTPQYLQKSKLVSVYYFILIILYQTLTIFLIFSFIIDSLTKLFKDGSPPNRLSMALNSSEVMGCQWSSYMAPWPARELLKSYGLT